MTAATAKEILETLSENASYLADPKPSTTLQLNSGVCKTLPWLPAAR
jgi:hypothetical protein